jgi:TP901 family phage tail tape measure protein
MPSEAERIQLELYSSFNAHGLKEALDIYEQVYDAHAKLEARLKTPLSFNLSGMGSATQKAAQLSEAATTKVERFHDALIGLGDPQTAAKIATGQTNINRVLADGGKKLDSLKKKAEDAAEAVARQTKFRTNVKFQELFPPNEASKKDRESLAALERMQREDAAAKAAYNAQKRRQKELSNAAIYQSTLPAVTPAAAAMNVAEEAVAKGGARKKSADKMREDAQKAAAVQQKIADDSARAGLLQTKVVDGQVAARKFAVKAGVTEEVKYGATHDTTIRTTNELADATARLTSLQQTYGGNMQSANKDLKTKLALTDEHIGKLKEEAANLAASHPGSPEGQKAANALAAATVNQTKLTQQIDAQKTAQEKAAEAAAKQATQQERLARVAQVAGRFDTLRSGAQSPLEEAALLERKAAALRKVAEGMRQQGVDEEKVRKVQAQANSAANQARGIRGGMDTAAEKAQTNLQRQIYLEEELAKAQRIRQVYAKALADETLTPGQRTGVLNAQTAALQNQAAAMRQMGMTEKEISGVQAAADRADVAGIAQRTKEQAKLAETQRRINDAQAAAAFNPQGYAVKSERTRSTGGGAKGATTTETSTYTRPLGGGMQETVKIAREFNAAGQNINTTFDKQKGPLAASARGWNLLKGSMLANIVTVAKWGAAVAVVQGVAQAMKSGVAASVELESQTAILVNVFQHGTDEAYKLRDGVLELAVAQGRSSEEAIQAAVRFSRMGLTRSQVMDAVTVSLMAANVAEITTAEAAERLAAVMVTFQLSAREAGTVLNELNTISNTYNVTNKDLLDGLSRVGNLAKQVKLPLEEVMGIIGTGVGRTGQTGAEFGNALKALLVTVGNPSSQKKLSDRFGFDVTDSVGEMKGASQILSELYVKYQALGSAGKQALLATIGNKQQASRIAAIMDGYVNTQVLAIRAQRDLNSAEREQASILATTKSQVTALGAQWDKLWVSFLGSDPLQGLLKGLTEVLADLDKMSKWKQPAWMDKIDSVLNQPEDVREERYDRYKNKIKGWFGMEPGEVRTAKQPGAGGGMDKRAEELTKAAGAYREAINLYKTAADAQEQPFFSDEQARLQAKGVAEVAYPKDEEKQRGLEKELTLLNDMGDNAGYRARMTKLAAAAATGEKTVRAELMAVNTAGLAVDKASLAIIEREIIAKFRAGEATDDLKSKEIELTDRIAARLKVQNTPFNPEGESGAAVNREKHAAAGYAGRNAALERFAAALPPAFTPTEEVQRELQTLRARKALYEETNAAVQKQQGLVSETAANEGRSLKGQRAKAVEGKAYNDRQRDIYDQGAKELDALGPERYDSRGQPSLAARIIGEKRGFAWKNLQERPGHPESIGAKEDQAQIDNIDKLIGGARERYELAQNLLSINGALTRQATEALDIEIRQAAAAQRTAEATTAVERAKKNATAQGGAYLVGRTETEKLLSQSSALINRSIPTAASRLSGDQFAAAAPNTEGKDRYRLDAIGQMTVIQQHLNTLRQNEDTLLATSLSKQAEILNIQQRQTQEASKGLLLASRGEQLQAALAQRFAQKRGKGFSTEDFQFLSQGTRQNIDKYNPNLAPAALNTELSEAKREQALATQGVVKFRTAIEELVKRFAALDPQAAAKDYQGADKPPETGLPPVPQLNVAFGGVNIQFSDQFRALVDEFKTTAVTGMRVYVDPQIAELRGMISEIGRSQGFTNAAARE